MLSLKKTLAIVASLALSVTIGNLSVQSASAAVVQVSVTNANPVTDVTTGSTVALAGVVGDEIRIFSSEALVAPITVNFGGASSLATPVAGIVNTYAVEIPAGAKTAQLTISDLNSAHTATTPSFQIWMSRTEPYEMPSGHLNLTYGDLKRILDQVKIGEAHSTRTRVANATTNFLNNRAVATTPVYPYDVTSATRCLTAADIAAAATPAYGPTLLSDRYFFSNLNPWGLRQVDGACNNISNVTSEVVTAGKYGFVGKTNDTANWGAADQLFTRSSPKTTTSSGSQSYTLNDVQKAYQNPNNSVRDPQPRIISNIISDQSPNNPAAVAAGHESNGTLYGDSNLTLENAVNATTGNVTQVVKIDNVTADYNVSAGFNSWFTWFGQFFDHGLDLIPKGNATVLIPLDQNDPVYVNSPSAPNFMMLTRTSDANGESINETTPYIDQSQTYGSHPSQNFFVREYKFAPVTGIPSANGRLLEGLDQKYTTLPSAWLNNRTIGGTLTQPTGTAVDAANDGLPTWRDIKAQALLLGFALSDNDTANIPVIATDQYGKFIPSSTGFPQMLFTNGTEFVWASGDRANPVSTGTPNSVKPAGGTSLAGRGSATNWVAVSSGHAFIVDFMNSAVPSTSRGVPLAPDADSIINSLFSSNTYYDDESLNQHLVAGDGRVNENIGLQALHNVFHSEHNTVAADILDELANNPVISAEFKNEWSGERLYQGARMVMESEYQHMVFDEFARRLSPNLPAFVGYNAANNGAITAEFASAVYRLGHSMLTETIPRSNPGKAYDPENNQDVSLLTGFTNPAQGRLQRPMTIESASHLGSSITYTLKTGETAPLVGQIVSVTGLDTANDANVNVTNAVVSARNATTFTVASYYAGGASASTTAIANAGSVLTSSSKVASTNGALLARVAVNDPGSTNFTYGASTQTAMLASGLVAQRGNEIDEFTTDAVRNNLLGLPLDLPALNITRGREVGIATLNQFREKTGGTLQPYASWNDFIDALRYIESGANFLAAYGKHPHITGPVQIVTPTRAVSNGTSIVYETADTSKIVVGDVVSIEGFDTLNVNYAVVDSIVDNTSFTVTKAWANSPSAPVAFATRSELMTYAAAAINKAAATENSSSATVTREPNVAERRTRAQDVLDLNADDANNFLNGVGAWDSANSGVDDIDLWVGGLAENPYKQPMIPPMLGPTFQHVFEEQMLKLHDGDRLYYLSRISGSNLIEEIAAQRFTDMVRRNTPSASDILSNADATGLVGMTSPGFSISDCSFSDPTNLVPSAVRCAASTLRLDGLGTLIHRGLDNITAFADLSAHTGSRIAGGAGDDSIQGSSGDDYLSGGLSGGDLIHGFSGNDILMGGAGEDVLGGDAGNDVVNGGESQLGDLLDGGPGVDFIHNGNATGPVASAVGGTGDDFIQGGKDSDLLLEGGDGADWIEGGANADALIGDFGLFGGVLGALSPFGGNDVLNGGEANDLLGADGGDDILNLGEGVDGADGGTGFDFVNYERTKRFDNGPASKPAAYIDLSGANPNLLALPGDGYLNIEGASGGPGNDTFFGSLAADFTIPTVTGVAGADVFVIPGLETRVQPGMLVTGTGIAPGAVVLAVAVATVNGVTTTTVDVSLPNAGAVNGPISFTTYALTAPQTVTGLTELVRGTPGWLKYTNLNPAATKWSGGNILLGGAGNNSFTLLAGQNIVHGSAQLRTCIYVKHNGVEFNTGADTDCASGRGFSTMSLISKQLDKGRLLASDLRTVKEIVSTNIGVTGVSATGTAVTYVAPNSFVVGDRVNVSGMSSGSYNVIGGTVTAATSSTFTVAMATVAASLTQQTGRAGYYNTLVVPTASTATTVTRITSALPAGAMTGYMLTSAAGTDYVYDIGAITFSNAVTTVVAPWVSTLSALRSSVGTMTPAFNPTVTDYTVVVPAATATATITPTASSAGEVILINATPVVSGVASLPVTLAAGAPTSVIVSGTSADGTSATYYTVTFVRAGLTPTFGARTFSTATGLLNSTVSNYNPLYTYTITSNVGVVRLGTPAGTSYPYSVAGVAAGQSVTINVTVSRVGYATTSTNTTSAAAANNMALIPLFDTPVATTTGFTVNVINYDARYAFNASASTGYTAVKSAAVGSKLLITVAGQALVGQSPVLTVATTRTTAPATVSVSNTVSTFTIASLGIQSLVKAAPKLAAPAKVAVSTKAVKATKAAKAKASKHKPKK